MKHFSTRFLILTAVIAVSMTACQESLEQKAAHEALMFTQKNCPVKMSDNLVIDSMVFEADTRTLHYYYTLTAPADSVGLFSETLKKVLLTDLKNTTALMAYKEAGYRFAYTYYSQEDPNIVLFEAIFSEKDYKQK